MGCTILYNRPWQYIYIHTYLVSPHVSLWYVPRFWRIFVYVSYDFFGRSPPICQGGGEGAIHEPQGPADVRSRFRMSTGGELSHEQNITYIWSHTTN